MHVAVCRSGDDTSRLTEGHQNIAKLIVMHRDSSTALSSLKVEHERLKWTLSDMYSRDRERETSRMGYAYGDHSEDKT